MGNKCLKALPFAAVIALVLAVVPCVAFAGDVGDLATGELAAQADSGSVPMYRLYNPWTGEHFYTMQETERDNTAAAGWRYEGVGWVAPGQGTSVWRLYNPYAGDHHYTMDDAERDYLVAQGWKLEGAGWVSAGDVQLYREYNPNMQSHNHNYTADKAEHDSLIAAGWHDEGRAWCGVAEGYSDPESLGYDDLTGKYIITGGASPTAVRDFSVTPTRMLIDGYLCYYGGKKIADSYWVFGVDDRTEYGYAMWDGFHPLSRDEFNAMFAGKNFVGITLDIENGIVKRATESS